MDAAEETIQIPPQPRPPPRLSNPRLSKPPRRVRLTLRVYGETTEVCDARACTPFYADENTQVFYCAIVALCGIGPASQEPICNMYMSFLQLLTLLREWTSRLGP